MNIIQVLQTDPEMRCFFGTGLGDLELVVEKRLLNEEPNNLIKQ
jgi:hypothetical protein